MRVLATFAVAGGVLSACTGEPELPRRVKVIETGPLAIQGIQRSMAGPYDRVPVDTSDIDWVTAFRAEVIDDGSREKMGDEFFCHSQVQLANGTRLMTTATGAEEIRFPEGFGMPVARILKPLSPLQREITFLGMVLNNHEPTLRRSTRVRGTIEYLTDEDVGDPPRLKKLFKVDLPMMVHDIGSYPTHQPAMMHDDTTAACVLVGGDPVHWMVPPGPQRTRLRYRDFLPVDVTVHYALVHLHNHGRFFLLRDVTTDEVLFRTDVIYEPDRVQIAEIPVYSSTVGFRMPADHEYEIEAFYDNTSPMDVDAMAAIALFYHPDGDVDIAYPDSPEL